MMCHFKTLNAVVFLGSSVIARRRFTMMHILRHIFQLHIAVLSKTQCCVLAKFEMPEGLHKSHYATTKLTCDLLVT